MLFVGEDLAAFVGFVILVAVSSLSVAGLLNYYEVVESDADRRVFKLHLIVDAENFNLNAKFVPELNLATQFVPTCEQFIANTTGKEIELWLKKKADLMKEEDRYKMCMGALLITVACKSASDGMHYCDQPREYHVNLRVKNYVSFCIVCCALDPSTNIPNISFVYTIVPLISACPTKLHLFRNHQLQLVVP